MAAGKAPDAIRFERRVSPATRIEVARARSRLQGAVRAHLSARGFDEGYQSVPVNWGMSSARKKGFFELVSSMSQ